MTGPRPPARGPFLDAAVPVGEPLTRRLRSLRDEAARTGDCVVLAALTLGNAPQIADALGAGVLDEVTSAVAGRAVAAGPHVQLLAVSPLGGVVAALVCPPAERDAVAADLMRRCGGFIVASGHRVWPVVTLGLRALDGATHPTAALVDLRATVFDAIRRAPGSLRWHDPGTTTAADRSSLDLVADLADALADPDDQLQLVFQPVVDLPSRRVRAVEALLRWHHPRLGPVSPLVAVRAAEHSGLIHPLGAWVLDRAMAQAAAWWAAGRRVLVHVNVSAYELRSASYADALAAAAGRHALPAEAILLELTETSLMAGDAEVGATLLKLRRMGVGLGIDDFGTGWSSISQLLHLPVGTVKVDRSLVSRIDSSPADFDLLRALLGMLATTPVEVVVEGVENATQAAHLQALGCRLAQGYHFGRPAQAADLALPRSLPGEGEVTRRCGPNGSPLAAPGVA